MLIFKKAILQLQTVAVGIDGDVVGSNLIIKNIKVSANQI